jgi:hypothetical protein
VVGWVGVVVGFVVVWPNIGRRVLEQYRPLAQYEARALNEIVRIVREFPSANLEEVIARLIPGQLRWSFSKNRGVALLHLAAELGKFRHIRKAIELELERSGSFEIQIHRDAIHDALRKSRHGRTFHGQTTLVGDSASAKK